MTAPVNDVEAGDVTVGATDQLIVVVIPLSHLATLTELEAACMVTRELALRADRLLIQRDDSYQEVHINEDADDDVIPRPTLAESLTRMIERGRV